MLHSLSAGQTVLCTKAQVNTDYRMFLFFDHYDSALPATVNRWQSVNEIVITWVSTSYVYTLKTQVIQYFSGVSNGYSQSKIFTVPTSTFFILHSFIGTDF